MLRRLIVLACFSLMTSTAFAQEVVHALTGTVSAINPAGKTITVFTDQHFQKSFKDLTDSKVPISFDKKIREEATPVNTFKTNGAYVIVFFYGQGASQTAVAMRNLGNGPFAADTGTVAKFDSHDHSLSIKEASGVEESFKISAQTVAETGIGAVEGFNFHPQKGDQVRVVSSAVSGNPTALFVSNM
jgi:hypothetical protein